MQKRTQSWWFLVGLALLGAALLVACGGAAAEPTAEPTAEPEEEHMDEGMQDEGMQMEGDEHGMEHLQVPEEAAAVQNPIEADDVSIATGKELYDTNCAVCHGEGGKGDGPGGSALDPPPADLTDTEVGARTDGALFWIITNGIEETAMPAWGALSEDDRWHIVNYIRTLE